MLALVSSTQVQARPAHLLFQIDGLEAGATFGATVIPIGDLDGDGTMDIAIGAPLAVGPDGFVNGRVFVHSGASANALFQLDPLAPRGQFGLSLARLDDVDGDGVPDILVGAPYTSSDLVYGVGSVLIFSGASAHLLYNILGAEGGGYMGFSVTGTADLDGDGVSDFAVGTPYGSGGQVGAGNAAIRSGADGSLIYQISGAQPGDYLGWAMTGIGDINGDGMGDLLIGSPSASPAGRPNAGTVVLVSGGTGEVLYELGGTEPAGFFGQVVASVGDIDGDGVPDFAVGAPEASPHGLNEAGSVLVFSGAAGKLLFRLDGTGRYDQFGAAVAGGGDIDGDGVPDLVVGAPEGSPGGRVSAGSVFAFSGATGQLLFRVDGESRGINFGRSVAIVGDLNGDGKAEIAVGAPYASPQGRDGAGSVFIFSY
jgi:hypothetical protein